MLDEVELLILLDEAETLELLEELEELTMLEDSGGVIDVSGDVTLEALLEETFSEEIGCDMSELCSE